MNGIRTVEQLALAADGRISILGPFAALKQKAKDWLDEEKRGAGLNKLREENNALTARVAAMEAMLKTATAEIEAARNAGGVLTTPAPADPRIAALEARLNALISGPVNGSMAPPEGPKRKGGRPKGSKNKPKVPPVEG
jgi:hypothetical protein